MTKIAVILGSTRRNRFGDKPARWIVDALNARPGVEAELLDLRDFPMPFFDEPVSPGYKQADYENEAVVRWTRKIGAADGFVMIAPEYNHGYPAVLKNAIDYVYPEWVNKPVGFVSYGSSNGVRSVEQLRQVVVELQMAPIRTAVHLPWELYLAIAGKKGPVGREDFAPSQAAADTMIDQLLWWTEALKVAREAKVPALEAA